MYNKTQLSDPRMNNRHMFGAGNDKGMILTRIFSGKKKEM